jgi:hypothetical protein
MMRGQRATEGGERGGEGERGDEGEGEEEGEGERKRDDGEVEVEVEAEAETEVGKQGEEGRWVGVDGVDWFALSSPSPCTLRSPGCRT